MALKLTTAFLLTALCACSTHATAVDGAADAGRPNILLIFVDDLGWSDIDHAQQHLPAIHRLAAEGLRFDHAYANAANCAPSRAALLSGLHAARTGVYTVGSGKRGQASRRKLEPPPNRTSLAASFQTLPERLQDLGYRTGFVGKWHLGSETEGLLPTDQGFDFAVAGDQAGHPPSYRYPYLRGKSRMRDLSPPISNAEHEELDPTRADEFLTARLTDEAIRFLEQQDGTPWFLMLSHYGVHTPLMASTTAIDALDGTAKIPGQRAAYTGMLLDVDRSVDRLLDFLEESELADNTLVLFTSDNGGLGGYRAEGIPGSPEVTTNAPLRGGKGMYTEGGIRVPMIARLPGMVAPGRRSDVPLQLFDLYPTLIEVAGGAPTQELPLPDGRSVPPDGTSFAGILQEDAAELPTRALYWHFPGYLESGRENWRTTPVSVIRDGAWKLRVHHETGAAELHQLQSDPSEQHDLHAKETEVAARLHTELEAWLERTEAPRATLPSER